MAKRRVGSFLNMANGVNTLSLENARGRNVHALFFELGGTFDKSDISSFKITLNGKSIVPDITAANLGKVNGYDGKSDTIDVLAVYFGNPLARTLRGEHSGDLDLSFTDHVPIVEMTIAGTVSPACTVYADYRSPKALILPELSEVELRSCRCLVRTPKTYGAAVADENLPLAYGAQSGLNMARIFLFHTNLTKARHRKDSIDEHENLSDALNDAAQDDAGKTPQAGLYVIDFASTDNYGDMLPTRLNGQAVPHETLVTTSAADTVTGYVDGIAPWELL